MSELELCPFCGGEASHDMAALPSDNPKFGTAWIVCHTCGTTGPMFDFRTDAEVIESHWNTRHTPEGYKLVPVETTIEKKTEWISLDSELPPDKKTVLVCTAKGDIYTCRLPVIIQKNSRPEGYGYKVERFTHWMSLPSLPEPLPAVGDKYK